MAHALPQRTNGHKASKSRAYSSYSRSVSVRSTVQLEPVYIGEGIRERNTANADFEPKTATK